MKKILMFMLALCMASSLVGCDAVQRKFIRKKKEKPAPRIYQLKKYVKKPTPELYKKHYSYWVSWQDDLIRVLGENHKKDVRCMEEIVGNLKDMQNILVVEKANELEKHIERIEAVRGMILSENLGQANLSNARSTLVREDRYIKRDFCYAKVRDYLKKSFEDESS